MDNKDFKEFKKWGNYYQKKFGLTGYNCYYKDEELEGCFANVAVSEDTRVATFRLNKKLDKDEREFSDVKKDAKHEMLHLMLNKLQYLATLRYVRDGEIEEVAEGIVCKLTDLVED